MNYRAEQYLAHAADCDCLAATTVHQETKQEFPGPSLARPWPRSLRAWSRMVGRKTSRIRSDKPDRELARVPMRPLGAASTVIWIERLALEPLSAARRSAFPTPDSGPPLQALGGHPSQQHRPLCGSSADGPYL
jgi:hypothetical protein